MRRAGGGKRRAGGWHSRNTPQEEEEQDSLQDVSLMDTEPMFSNGDAEVDNQSNTTDESGNDGEDASTADEDTGVEGEDESSEDEGGGETEGVVDATDVEMNAEASSSEMEDEEVMSPVIDITLAPSYEIKRIYSDLMDSCRELEGSGMTEESERILKENITTGEHLFRQMETTLSGSMSDTQTFTQRNALGNSVSDVYLACQHTKMCSTMLKQKVRSVGAVASSFKLDDFLNSLRRISEDDNGTYSVFVAVNKLNEFAATIGRTAPCLKFLYGSFDKEDLARAGEPFVKKERQPRKPRQKEDESQITQTEILNESVRGRTQSTPEADTPEGLARDILKSVKLRYKQEGNVPQNLLDVGYADKLPDLLSRMFGVAFVVRDGRLRVTNQDNSEDLNSNAMIMLTPAKPPATSRLNDDDSKQERSQTIVSFSAQTLKHLKNLPKGN